MTHLRTLLTLVAGLVIAWSAAAAAQVPGTVEIGGGGGLTLMQFIASMGVGGVLAYAMFSVYRKDMLALNKRWDEEAQAFKSIVVANTTAITTLTERLEAERCPIGRADCPLTGDRG